ncbi:CCA tRNA nucleotidyltransferase, partial [Acidisphaera rubrifaciens]|uniref:CCA tRNA nucleotidyltransferase n=1 Tax=Acidisphaera rubrifaciens TaxID=50715 RepID=UPI001F524D32
MAATADMGGGEDEAPARWIDPPDFLVRPALAEILSALPGARVVGGAVRDALAGRPVADIDVATPEPPARVTERLEAAGLRVVPTGLAHGTVTAVTPDGPVEVTTLRRDEATDGRHAVVAFTADWRADAARRDFTINALSLRPDGAVFDYFGGLADLDAGRVRFVGDPAQRIAEDYLRILRYFRFQARYGRVPPDAATAAALRAGVPGLARLSAERVWGELRRILVIPDPLSALRLMAALGVLAAVLPGAVVDDLAPLIAAGAPPDPLLRLAALTAEDAAALGARLRLANHEQARLETLRGTPAPGPGDSDDALRRLLADIPADIAALRAWLAQARHGRDGGAEGWDALRARLAVIERPVFPLAGRDA